MNHEVVPAIGIRRKTSGFSSPDGMNGTSEVQRIVVGRSMLKEG